MNLKNTYFGFTKQGKAMLNGRIEKTLDTVIRSDSEYMLQKEWIYSLLKKGYTPNIEEDYTYYKRNGELSKPKTLHMLSLDGSWYETNKTLNNYATYLIENDLLNEEKAIAFIEAEEKAIAEAEKAKEEEKKRIKLENERKREQEKIESEERIKKNIEKGKSFINERGLESMIEELTTKHWEGLKPHTSKDFEGFINDVIIHFAKLLCNMEATKNNLQYLLHDCPDYSKKRIENIYQEEVLKTIFNVNDSDSKQTITAKVKAFYANREYKGGNYKPSKIETFYRYDQKESGFVEQEGEAITIEGVKCFMWSNGKYYNVTELRSGLSISQLNSSKTEAKEKAKNAISKNKERLESAIESAVKAYGEAPNKIEKAS